MQPAAAFLPKPNLRITIAAGCAEVEYFRLNDHGGVLGHQRAVATVVTNIRIESE